MTTYDYRIGVKIWDWLEKHSGCDSRVYGWSSEILMYIGKEKVALEWQEYGLDKEGQALWDLGYDGFEREDRCWETFMCNCHSHIYTDYSRIVGRSFLQIDRKIWDTFVEDFEEVINDTDLTWDYLSLRKLPRAKMNRKNTIKI